MNMKLVNLTPHEIRIINGDGTAVAVPPSGAVLRVAVTRSPLGQMAGVDVFETIFGDLEVVENGLSSPAFGPGATFRFDPEKMYVVSGLCGGPLAPYKGEMKFASPGELVRDAGGQPTGCKGLTLI